jgi:hypothetical protein
MVRPVNFAKKLRKLAANLEELATALEAQGNMPASKGKIGKSAPARTRRSKKDVAALKKMLKAERKSGVPVAELAAKHGVSTAYIYMLQ